MKKIIVFILELLIISNLFCEDLAGKVFFWTGPESEMSYSFTHKRFIKFNDKFYENSYSPSDAEAFFYEIKYENKLPYIYYWKDDTSKKKNQKKLILFNDDYFFLCHSQSDKSFLEPIGIEAYCTGKYSTSAKVDPIIKRFDKVKYSSVLKEGNHEYKFPEKDPWWPCIAPWVPDLTKDNNPSITFYEINDYIIKYKERLIIVNGYVNFEKPYLYEQNSRVKKIEVIYKNTKTNNSVTQKIELEDTPNPQYIFIPENIVADEITINIIDLYKGTKYKDVAISYLGY